MSFADYVTGGRLINTAFEADSICADPLFVDPENEDFRLKIGSPCINTADDSTLTAGDTDLDGRLWVVPVEMGAYQFMGMGSLPDNNIYIPKNWYLPSNLYTPDNLNVP